MRRFLLPLIGLFALSLTPSTATAATPSEFTVSPTPNLGPARALGIAAASGFAGRSAAPAQAASVSGFTVVHGVAFSGQLRAVSARTPSDVWAVGALDDPDVTNDLRPYAEHWDGHTWRSFPAPMPPKASSAFFVNVSAVSENDVWAAGSTFFPDGNGGFVEHWNGTRWSMVAGAQGVDVFAVSADSVWVTGAVQPEHWNGSTWTTVTPPTVDGAQLSLDSATGKPHNVWFAATDYNNTTAATPEMVHWDGTHWTVYAQPVAPPNLRAVIQGLSMSATGRVYGVGFTDQGGDPDIMHVYGRNYDNGVWSAAPLTQYPDFHQLISVAATGDGQAWAVGQRFSQNGYRNLIEHWDNASNQWIDVGGPNPCPHDGGLSSVAAVGGTQTAAYAVSTCGDTTGEHPVILHHS